MRYIVLIMVVVTIGFYSCKAKETKKVEQKMVVKEKNLLADGFKKGIVVLNPTSETCSQLIKLKDSNEVLEPFKKLSSEFNIDKLVVYVKFIRQRRMSKCENTQPVELLEIKK